MRHISIVLALSTLLFVATASGQQTKPGVGIDTVVNCTIAKNNYVPLFTSAAPPNIVICNSVIYQASGNIGIGTTTPAAALDVVGNVNTSMNYQIGASSVLGIGGAGDFNLFVGVGAGINNVSGADNTFSGSYAGADNTTGGENTFVGANAGTNNTTGGSNVFSGGYAGYSNTTGTLNTFSGAEAGQGNTTGSDNTFVGAEVGLFSTTGSDNTFSGAFAGYSNTTGYDNTFSGVNAGLANTTGPNNTYIGALAGQNNTSYFNTFVGYGAGINNTGGNENVYIANQGLGSATESNTTRIGDPSFQFAAYIAGIYGVTASGGLPVYINSNGQLGTSSSSLRFKEQVRDMGDSTNALMKLRPVTFFYKPEYANGERTLQYGLIAEEVAKLYPELVAYDKDGKPYSVRYQYLTTMLLNEVQKQYRQAEAQAALIKAQQQEIEGLQKQLQVQNATLQERLSRLESAVRVEVASAK